MRTKTEPDGSADGYTKEFKHKTRRDFSAEETIRNVRDGLRERSSILVLCRREGIAKSLYYNWANDFIEAAESDGLAMRFVKRRLVK